MAIIKKSTTMVWLKGIPLHCWEECKLVQPLWRTVQRFLKKLALPNDPGFPVGSVIKNPTAVQMWV